MNCFKRLFSGIKKDYLAYAKEAHGKFKPLLKVHFYCNLLFRFSHFFYQIKLLPLAKVFWGINRFVFTIDIDPGARLNGGFVIIHGFGIVIGRYVISEGDFHIFHGATLGGNYGKESNHKGFLISQPYINEGVVIGINAVVLGPVVLERGARIGANAVITRDVPAHCTVVGNNKILNIMEHAF